jgi:hypothetical protein
MSIKEIIWRAAKPTIEDLHRQARRRARSQWLATSLRPRRQFPLRHLSSP